MTSSQSTPVYEKIRLNSDWKEFLKEEFEKEYFTQIKSFIQEQKSAGKQVFPPGKEIFNAFELTPLNNVKVVILGQDPYHGNGQAHGLSFSVPDGVKQPPSLQNIFKEISQDCDCGIPFTGNLTPWALQGVLLLNAILTVNASEPASHKSSGWEIFTDAVIQKLSDSKENLVFMLWGNFARQKKRLINSKKHLILEAAHPSPFSAYQGFFGCKHFSKANDFLNLHHQMTINWCL